MAWAAPCERVGAGGQHPAEVVWVCAGCTQARLGGLGQEVHPDRALVWKQTPEVASFVLKQVTCQFGVPLGHKEARLSGQQAGDAWWCGGLPRALGSQEGLPLSLLSRPGLTWARWGLPGQLLETCGGGKATEVELASR